MNTSWHEMTDGHPVFLRTFPNNEAVATIFILHGLAEHSGRYKDYAEFLVSKGFEVCVPDHRGHGETGIHSGKLGYFAEEDGFERVVDDVNELIQLHKQDKPHQKIILLGHSMGSFLARRYVQKYPAAIDKLVLVGTGGDPGIMGAVGSAIARFRSRGAGSRKDAVLLNKLTFGNYNKAIDSTTTEFDWLSTDSSVVQAYIADPLCGFVSTNKLYADLLTGLQTIHKNQSVKAMRKDLPILLIAGSDDPVGNYGKGVRAVAKSYEKAGFLDVKLVLIENERHEILNGKTRQTVYDQIIGWL